ncbi:hypothetical protein M8C21_033131 [Ambrosia artemisiifolia]|uniref:WRKY domain-containing protein n=1 Tax=Ambrosia artemisiifolia TaxID=4212 RepID=A0AAD5D5W9_AMBAR|nr:hypothetical protein M8C21_033131 [Ambrosia artemisiifolia]
MAVDFVGIQSVEHLNRMFQLTNHDFTVSAVKRTGHARFRRGPSPAIDSHAPSTSTQSAPAFLRSSENEFNRSVNDTTSSSSRSTNSSLLSPLGIGEENSVSNGKQFTGLGIVAPMPAFSNKKPPLPSSHRKRCRSDRPSVSLNGARSESHGCHCCKRRVYYKCSSGKGCPARKSVEIAVEDSKMLIVTYAGEHNHRLAPMGRLTDLTGSVVQSK